MQKRLLLLIALLLTIAMDDRLVAGHQDTIDRQLVRQAFEQSHDGWSVDEVLLDDRRRATFLEAAHRLQLPNDEQALCEALIAIRKSGKLEVESTRRANVELEAYEPLAEIAARKIQDSMDASTDAILTSPKVRQAFDDAIMGMLPDETHFYPYRKAALKLRKSRKLQPELTLRVTDWKRELKTMSLEEAKRQVESFPKRPAIYLFQDKTGYLYIGQTQNLRERMMKHLSDSDRQALARYLERNAQEAIQLELHIFAEDSPAKETRVREAYESELIRSRKPRLNIAP
ncbi:MAG: GIY-YIG nuclease family protein [Pirellulales bacterium]